MRLHIRPISFKAACQYIRENHRHHLPPQGHKFSISVYDGEKMVGVAVVGRPISRLLDDGVTAEVTRLCSDGTKNACSMLYAACWRAARAMGYTQLITYILSTEPGITLAAAGWKCAGSAGGGTWNCPSRPRKDKAPVSKKVKYYITNN